VRGTKTVGVGSLTYAGALFAGVDAAFILTILVRLFVRVF